MSKTDFYCQCSLRKKSGKVVITTTSWIPQCYANKGEFLMLKNEAGEWVDGWEVMNVSPPMDAESVERNSRDYLRQRQASDV